MPDLIITGVAAGPCGCCGEPPPFSCRSKTGEGQLPACSPSESTYSRTCTATAPSDSDVSTAAITLTPVSDNGDGTWRYQFGISVSSSLHTVLDAWLDTGSSEIRDGDFIDLLYCEIFIGTLFCSPETILMVDLSGVGEVGWSGRYSSGLDCSGNDCTEVQTPGWTGWPIWDPIDETFQGPNYALALEQSAELPFDSPSTCRAHIGYPVEGGSFPFTVIEVQASFSELTIGLCYRVRFHLQWKLTSESTWNEFDSPLYFDYEFEADSTEETTPWLNPLPTFPLPFELRTGDTPPDYEIRVADASITEISCP